MFQIYWHNAAWVSGPTAVLGLTRVWCQSKVPQPFDGYIIFEIRSSHLKWLWSSGERCLVNVSIASSLSPWLYSLHYGRRSAKCHAASRNDVNRSVAGRCAQRTLRLLCRSIFCWCRKDNEQYEWRRGDQSMTVWSGHAVLIRHATFPCRPW